MNLVIFDCDGVVVDSESLSYHAFVDHLLEHEIKISAAITPARFKGRKLADCLLEAEEISGKSLPSDFEKSFREKMDRYFSEKLQAVRGIEEALKNISHPFCLASNGPLKKIQRSLEITGLTRYFGENIFSAYTVQKWKPAPDLFLHACARMGSTPSRTVVVEDSIPGIQAALTAKMFPFAFGREEEFGCFAGISSFREMTELPKLVDEVFASFSS